MIILLLFLIIIVVLIIIVKLAFLGSIYLLFTHWRKILKGLFLASPTLCLLLIPPTDINMFINEFFAWFIAQTTIIINELWRRKRIHPHNRHLIFFMVSEMKTQKIFLCPHCMRLTNDMHVASPGYLVEYYTIYKNEIVREDADFEDITSLDVYSECPLCGAKLEKINATEDLIIELRIVKQKNKEIVVYIIPEGRYWQKHRGELKKWIKAYEEDLRNKGIKITTILLIT